MKFLSTVTAVTSALAIICADSASAKFGFGIPWGADNRWAKNIPDGVISWYHHWQMGYVAEMPKDVEYVPTFWGPQKYLDWEFRKAEISKFNSSHILAFNEPDVASQANLDPKTAAHLWMKELQPYALKGKNVSSPQMVYNMDWLEEFMDECSNCKIGFMALHWYGSYKDMDLFKAWVQNVHQKFKLPVWVTEFGITSASKPSQQQVNDFASEAIQWLEAQDYVERAAWNGGYDVANPPDDYATPLNALFSSGGQFRSLANVWLPQLSIKLAQRNHQRRGHALHMVKRTRAQELSA